MRRSTATITTLVVVLQLLAGSVAIAQQREPFTGIARDALGQPVAGAHVECVWSPDAFTGGVVDRRQATTDQNGRFAVDLWIGHAYCVWAVGRADEDGKHLAMTPHFGAVGGKVMDLRLDRRLPRARPLITGTTPWIKAGPLSVRVFVAEDCALADDIPIPGDGIVNLPALPTDLPTLCLIDGNGQVLGAQGALAARVAFEEAVELSFVTLDDQGRPMANVEILEPVHVPTTIGRPLRQSTVGSMRLVATSDARGKCRGLVLGNDRKRLKMLHARLPGHNARPSGWWLPDRIEDGRSVGLHDEQTPITFTLRAAPPAHFQLRGAAAGDDVHAVLAATAGFRRLGGGGGIPLFWPVTAGPDGFAADTSVDGLVAARVTAFRSTPVPTRLLTWSGGIVGNGPLPDVDFTALRRITVEVVQADGAPASHTLLAIARSMTSIPVLWYCPVVTDADGRAVLAIPSDGGVLYARGHHAHGVRLLPESQQDQACTIKLEAFASASVRVLDAHGQPVADAAITTADGDYPGGTIGCMLIRGAADPLAGVRTDANGVAVLHVPAGFKQYVVEVSLADGRTAQAQLATDGAQMQVRLPAESAK